MKRTQRVYVVDDNDRLHRVPRFRYYRILTGQETVYLYAGKAIRFAETIVMIDGEGSRNAGSYFPLVYFDADGRRDDDKRLQELALAEQMFAAGPSSAWTDLYRSERDHHFRWIPDSHLLGELRATLGIQKRG